MGETQADRAEARRRAAERRHDELEALLLRLESGEKVSESDVEQASLRLADAQQRAVAAESSARTAHVGAAEAHQHAAAANEGAGHPTQAAQHRLAAERDLEAGREQGHHQTSPTTGA